jgi:hypothetical protein
MSDKKQIDWTKPVERVSDGSPVRVLCADRRGDSCPVVLLISSPSGYEFIAKCQIDGTYCTASPLYRNVPVKRVGYLNVYRNRACLHETRESAENGLDFDAVACVRVEYTEGQTFDG